MINITEIAKKFNRKPSDWLRTDNAQRIINEIANKNNCLSSDLLRVETNTMQKSTWVHKGIASVFIQWLSIRPKEKRYYMTYLMKDIVNNYAKIGRSIDCSRRHFDLHANNPNIKMLFVIKNDIEKQLHIKYKSKRMYGEWFNLTEIDIKSIKTKYHGRTKKI